MSRNRTLTWDLFLTEVLPGCLVESGVGNDQVTAIVDDVQRRARDYANGGRASRRALRVPFLDDVADFLPTGAPIGVKADTAVIVRNSLLEDAHAEGPVDDEMLVRITSLATGALNVWLSQNLNTQENDPPTGVFAGIANLPRAYAALQTLALAAENGGRTAFRMPDAEVPTRPSNAACDGTNIMTRRSGLLDLDEQFRSMLSAVADGATDLLVTSSLSRYSRNSIVLAGVVEFVLAYKSDILTTNFLVRPGETFARRPPFVAPNSSNPLSAFTIDRLPGLQAKYVRQILTQA